MNAYSVLLIVLSLLALLPSPSVQDGGLFFSGSLFSSSNFDSSKPTSVTLNVPPVNTKISASLTVPSLVIPSLVEPSLTVPFLPVSSMTAPSMTVPSRPVSSKSEVSASASATSSGSTTGNNNLPPINNFSKPSDHDKWKDNGNKSGPPNGGGYPESNRDSSRFNDNFSPNWNKENIERPTENGMYPYTNNAESTYKPPIINENTSTYNPYNVLPNRTEDQRQCRNDEFRCKNNECVPYKVKCDNKINCRDGSDEESCITNRNKQDESCILPEQPEGGHYKLGGCSTPCNKHPGDTVPKNSLLTYSCKNNYMLKGNNISVCIKNNWLALPSCVKICPTLNSTSVNILCSYQGKEVSCNERILPGTRATLSCKSSYKLYITNDPGYKTIQCLDDGLWDRPIFRCIPECGTSIGQGNTLIVNGFEAKLGEFPWHVGIYKKKNDIMYEQICGGSLISNDLIVSAAHCFYDEGFKRLNNVSNYAVAGGKHYRAWDVDEQYGQKSLVKDIKLTVRYIGMRGNFAEDIALIKLEEPFELSTVLRPICMDWENTYEREHLKEGQSGKVAGWGKNIKNESSPILYEVDMPYVPYDQCSSTVPASFRQYLTSDKFCAGNLNGSSVCDGDSGGGLCFKKNGLWYLRGIVSVGPPKGNGCDYNSYVGFTNIGHFRDWIREAYVSS